MGIRATPEAGPSATRLLAVAWARFQPRTSGLAAALGGKPVFVSGRLGRALPPVRYAASALQTWRLLERNNPVRVLAITPPVFTPVVCWSWCAIRRRQLVIDCHTGTLGSSKWGWADPVHRWLMRRASMTLLHTEEARALVDSWGAPALLFPDDLPEAAEATPAPAPARPTVLVAGSFDGNEPVAAVVEAARLLPDVELRLTGHPEVLPERLQESAPPNVVFTGFLPYADFLGQLMAAHVVAAFSTDPEIMNRAAFEAVGLGRPLVLSDLPGLRSRFGPAALFTANEPAQMAAGLRQALGQQEDLACRSRSLAVELRSQRDGALSTLRQHLDRPPDRRPERGGGTPAGDRPRSGGAGRAPRILMVTQHSPGEQMQVRRNLLELASRGFDVDVICSAGVEGRELTDLSQVVRIHIVPIRHRRKPAIRYPFEYLGFFLMAFGMASALSLRHRYDVVQVDNIPDHLAFVTPLPRLRGARLVLNMLEVMPEMVASRYPDGFLHGLVNIARWVERAATSWSDHVIVVSQDCWRRVHARGVPASKLSVVVNTTPWPDRHPPGHTALHPPQDGDFVVTHGTLVGRYGVHVAIEAFAPLAARWPALKFRVIGDGEARPELERLVEELGLQDRVEFTGYMPWPETIKEIRRAAVGIVSVVADGYGQILLPTKLLEYAALGVPTVCARLPAVEDYFPEDSVSYFEPGDAGQLSAQLDRLLGDQSLASKQACRAAEIAAELAWDRMQDVYVRALGLPGRAAPRPALAEAAHGNRA
jgi:glycosyltransferase involved in cell wall biosynthesis